MGGCLQWSVKNDETWVGVYSGVWIMMKHGWMITVECGEWWDMGGWLEWSVENTEICTSVYSGVWRMMRHGWVYTVECEEYGDMGGCLQWSVKLADAFQPWLGGIVCLYIYRYRYIYISTKTLEKLCTFLYMHYIYGCVDFLLCRLEPNQTCVCTKRFPWGGSSLAKHKLPELCVKWVWHLSAFVSVKIVCVSCAAYEHKLSELCV